jgi:ribonuclease T1
VYWTGSVPSSSRLRRALHKWGLTVAVVSGLAAGAVVQAKSPSPPDSAVAVALSSLPSQAQATHRLILSGGPFPYSKDGTVFGNRERLLPAQARGYYREYTVKTPGSRDRGARRIVCGGKPPTQPEACFYTDDHYASFKRIAP